MAEGDFKILDWLVLGLFVAWLCCFYPFILFNSQEEIDSKYQIQLLGFGFSFLVLTVYGGYAHSAGKHISLKYKLVDWWTCGKGFCIKFWYDVLHAINVMTDPLPSFLTVPVRHLWRLLNSPSVLYQANLALDVLIFFGAMLLGFATLVYFIVDKEKFTFLFQNCLALVLYLAFNMACCTEYTIHRLLNHIAYFCAHAGYICESLQYAESYLAIHIGLSTIVLNLVWFVLNYQSEARRFRNGAPDDFPAPGYPPDSPPGDDPPGDDPSFRDSPHDDPPDDRRKPKKPEWKQSSSGKKRHGKKKR